MKNAIIFHGTSCTPKSYWLPYVKNELEKKGYSVWIPALPDTDKPTLKNWLPVALQGKYNSQTVVIGHSAGSPLILSVLENVNVRINKAILVAGYARQREGTDKPDDILQVSYNWKLIKKHVNDIIFINSGNDPWKCDDIQGRYMFDRLGGTLIIKHDGHMGSDTFKQPYKKFPLLVSLADL